MHLCFLHMSQPQDSIDILQSIPAKQRTAKINMGLGQAYDRGGLSAQAVVAYKAALKASPLALDAAERLLALGVTTTTVLDIMTCAASEMSAWNSTGIVAAWIEAIGRARNSDWNAAARALRALDKPNAPLRGCPSVLVALGEVYYYSGEYKQAVAAFQRAHTADPLMLRGLDAYAACLSREGRLRERAEVLVPPSLPPAEYTIHHWLALAHLQVDRHRLPLAAYLAQKACFAEARNPEALLLKGNILMSMKKYTEALDHFREANEIAPDRYETYAGLAEAHIAVRRPRQAVAVSIECCRQFSNSPRALTLYANILLKEGEVGAASRAKVLLERALLVDDRYLPAALALAHLINTEEDSQTAIELLEKQVSAFPSSALHQALGEAWARKGGVAGAEQAVQHYGAALALEPGSRRALDALARLDKTPTTQQAQPSGATPASNEQSVEDADNTYELVTEANVPSDNSNAPEESETEAVWSDMDLEVP
ncbi:anaphase-promoting complex subunit 7 isoform X2 [Arctopsyche grandis]